MDMSRRAWWVVILLSAMLLVTDMITTSLAPGSTYRLWTFDDDPVGEVPRGWEVLAGKWEVSQDGDGRNHVLVQTGPPLPGFDLPAILAPTPPVRDLRTTGKIKPVGSGGFETMGLILRWRDPGTMTVIRVDSTPGRVRLERVQGGQRSLRAGYIAPLRQDERTFTHKGRPRGMRSH
jgi:hypothetical protein